MAVEILDDCCSPAYLDCLKFVAFDSENWNFHFPGGAPIEEKHLKLRIIENGLKHPFLAGLAMGLLIQIHANTDGNLFIPEIFWCGISMKDKHTPNNIHVDNEKDENFVKILGIINSDWKEEWGGGFFHDGTSNYIKPTSFCIFDPSKEHSGEEIFTDKKRFVIDFTVFRDQQSLEKWQIGNK